MKEMKDKKEGDDEKKQQKEKRRANEEKKERKKTAVAGFNTIETSLCLFQTYFRYWDGTFSGQTCDCHEERDVNTATKRSTPVGRIQQVIIVSIWQ